MQTQRVELVLLLVYSTAFLLTVSPPLFFLTQFDLYQIAKSQFIQSALNCKVKTLTEKTPKVI